jgi:hypothetical protein
VGMDVQVGEHPQAKSVSGKNESVSGERDTPALH